VRLDLVKLLMAMSPSGGASCRRIEQRRRLGSQTGGGARQGEAWAAELGHAGSSVERYKGARTPRNPRRARPGRLVAAVAPSASGRWASCGPGGLERVGPSGSAH
jgi:hypothetical protein